MKLQELVDIIGMRHPGTSSAQITTLVNRAIKDYCFRTEILESAYTMDGGTVKDKRWYDLPDQILRIKSVDVDDYFAPMLTGRPEKRDTT